MMLLQHTAFFAAGLELAESIGVLCTSTGRRITYTRDEIETGLRYAPNEVEAGDHRDKVTWRNRRPESDLPPGNAGGPVGQTDPEEFFIELMQSYAQEPILQAMWNGSLATVYGREGRTGSPYESPGTARKPLFQKRRQGGPEDQTSEEDALAAHRPKLGNCPLLLQEDLD